MARTITTMTVIDMSTVTPIRDVALRWGLGKRWLMDACADGRVRGVLVANRWVIPHAEIARIEAQGGIPARRMTPIRVPTTPIAARSAMPEMQA